MKWDEFVSHFSKEENPDVQSVSFSEDSASDEPIPFYVRLANRVTSDSLLYAKKPLFILVYPTDPAFQMAFVVYQIINDVLSKNILSQYDIRKFVKGQKLSLGNAVIVFDEIKEEFFKDEGKTQEIFYFHVKEKDSGNRLIRRGFYLPHTPILNKALSTAEVSSNKDFDKEFALFKNIDSSSISGKLQLLRTRQNEAVIFVTAIRAASERIRSSFLDHRPLLDSVSICKSDFHGELSPLEGPLEKPQIIVATDLIDAQNALENSREQFIVSALFVDTDSVNDFANRQDELDFFIDAGIPVIMLCPESHVFDFSLLRDRGFASLDFTRTLLASTSDPSSPLFANRAIRNCLLRKVDRYVGVSDDIANGNRILHLYSDTAQDLPSSAMVCFHNFCNLFFEELWRCLPVKLLPATETQFEAFSRSVEACVNERNLIPDTSFVDDMSAALTNLMNLVCRDQCHKEALIKERILASRGKSLLLVVPYTFVPETVVSFYSSWMASQGIDDVSLACCTERDFRSENRFFDDILLVGWLGRQPMREILMSNRAPHFSLLVHRCEQTWANAAICQMINTKPSLPSEFDQEIDPIENTKPPFDYVPAEKPTKDNDFSELFNNYRNARYKAAAGPLSSPADKIVKATPVSFSNDTIGFFTANFSLLSLTKMRDENGQPESINPADLRNGDVIAFNSSSTDLIRDLADKILDEQHRPDARKKATSWKDVFKVQIGLDFEEIYRRLVAAGLKRTSITVRCWLGKESFICPMKKEDLVIIAKAFDDHQLTEEYEQVFEAAKTVKAAHLTAGFRLAAGLRANAAFQDAIQKATSSMNGLASEIRVPVPDFGEVTIVQVIDIGSEGDYPLSQANKLKKGAN